MKLEILDFSPLATAGISAAQFARLCGANRVSVFKWLRGTNPRGLYHERAKAMLDAVNGALDRGALPLPKLPRSQQYDAIVNALNTR